MQPMWPARRAQEEGRVLARQSSSCWFGATPLDVLAPHALRCLVSLGATALSNAQQREGLP